MMILRVARSFLAAALVLGLITGHTTASRLRPSSGQTLVRHVFAVPSYVPKLLAASEFPAAHAGSADETTLLDITKRVRRDHRFNPFKKKKKNSKEERLKELTKQVAQSRDNLQREMRNHGALEDELQTLEAELGAVAKVQTQKWHNNIYEYTPKKNRWLTLPYWNGVACAVGVMTGPGGFCHRTLGKTLNTCSSAPDEKILATAGFYSSKDCLCSMCNGFLGTTVASPFCHTRGIPNTCHCMLVDNGITSEHDCLDLQ